MFLPLYSGLNTFIAFGNASIMTPLMTAPQPINVIKKVQSEFQVLCAFKIKQPRTIAIIPPNSMKLKLSNNLGNSVL